MRRRNLLTFAHHREVASLPPAEADALLDTAEAEGWTSKELRSIVAQRRNAIGEMPSGDTCTVDDLHALVRRGDRFGCIYADPPWRYNNQGTRAATGTHYGRDPSGKFDLAVEEICALPVADLAADAAHLWLWTTNGFLFECPRIFAAWGFEFKSSYVWCKPQIGIGNYLRNAHEFLLLAVRGGLVGQAKDIRSWGTFDRGPHSAKPEAIRTHVVERTSPGPYLELFGRGVVPGWTVWGNQVHQHHMFTKEVEAI